MSYKNDHLLVIMNKYGKSTNDANAMLFETYDKLRDLTVSSANTSGSGSGAATSFLMQFAKLISPSSFMPMLGTSYMNVPGTSYWSAASGGNSIFAGGNAAYNFGELGSYQGLPTGGAASMLMGFGSSLSSLMGGFSMDGQITGGAASMVGPSLNTAGAMMGMGSGYTGSGESILLPAAGIISGFGGILSAMGPYMGPFGLGATVAGNLAQGYGGATLAAYQSASGQILNNADTILTNKVKNIETVVKQLGAQSDVIKKMLKDNVEGDSKAVQNM